MMVSHFIAQALSLHFFVMGIAMMSNRTRFASVFNEIANSSSLIILSGVIALLFGILILLSHNIWLWSWPLLVTLSGWLAFLKGACLLIIPTTFLAWCKPLFTPERILITGCCLVLLGVLFSSFGFST
jgi:hypothetical protein